MPRDFITKDAAKARAEAPVPLMIGCTGPSGSGKTFTSLRLATGIQRVVGGDIFVIDTEQRRSLHYADQFKFKHVDFQAPYSSTDYLEALRYTKKSGAGVVVMDSSSHEHTGPGGLLEQHEQELDRMAGNDFAKRDRMTMLAWAKPKKKRNELITAITTELQMPIIFCFRAKTSTKPAPKGSQDRSPVEMGFTSIGADDWLFEMGLNLLFLPGADGVPTWESKYPGERLSMKCPRQFEWVKQEGQITEAVGQKLAEWAKGTSAPKKPASAPEKRPAVDDFDADGFLSEVAKFVREVTEGSVLETWWNSPVTTAKRKKLALADQEKSARARGMVADKIGALVASAEV